MKKQEEQQEAHELEEFEDHINLWNIPQIEGVKLLQKIVDSIHYSPYKCPGKQLPSILIIGDARNLIAKAFINSLKIEDIRECPGCYLDNGLNSSQIFEDSLINTAHLITDIEQLTTMGQSVVWRYLKERRCCYYNFMSKSFDKIIHCNGLIVLTAQNTTNLPQSILQEVSHTVKTEPFPLGQLKQLVRQQLQFCGIIYRRQSVINEILKIYPIDVTSIMQLVRTCITLLEANMSNCLTVKIVQEARKLCSLSVPVDYQDDIPF